MKTILLPYHDEEAGRTALNTAIRLATRFGCYLEGLLVLGPPPLTLGPGMALAPDYVTMFANEWRKFAATAREHFLVITEEQGLPYRELQTAGDQAAAGWREMDGKESEIVGWYGRLFDLIVMGRSAAALTARWRETCEAALFETGRPVLLAPFAPPEKIGRTILVAWNGSTESARTIAFAMPLLTEAAKVEVLSVKGNMVQGPTADAVANHLQRHGIPVTSRVIDAEGRPPGEAILDEASDIGADLVVKGAFTRNRLRQIVFGGTTQHILEFARIPVLMAH
jgi:nucleotide-binding universal stress UspA family protein